MRGLRGVVPPRNGHNTPCCFRPSMRNICGLAAVWIHGDRRYGVLCSRGGSRETLALGSCNAQRAVVDWLCAATSHRTRKHSADLNP